MQPLAMGSHAYVAVSRSVLQCVAACCSVLHRVAVCCSELQCLAACCSVSQRVAVCCSVLQCLGAMRFYARVTGF